MSFEPNATQAQTLLRLLFIPEEPAMSKLKPSLPPDKRKAMVDAGLIVLEKRGAAQYILLTDQGWAWVANNMDKLCPKTLNRLNPEILAAILDAFSKNMLGRGLSLAELVRPELFADGATARDSEVEEKASHVLTSQEPSREAVRRICRQLTEGRPGDRIRLAALRSAMPEAGRSELDVLLLQMQADNEIVLSTLERFEINSDDEAAVIHVAGLPRHVVYLKQI